MVYPHTKTPNLGRSALESVLEPTDSDTELTDSGANLVVMGRQSILYMFGIDLPIEKANRNQTMIAVG